HCRSRARLAQLEDELEPAPGDVVTRVGEQARVLRVAGEVEVELRRRRELERQRVAAQLRGMRLAQEGRGRDAAARLDSGQHRARPGLLELRELDRGWRAHGNGNGLRLRLWLGLRL